jgi:hypothetical protein
MTRGARSRAVPPPSRKGSGLLKTTLALSIGLLGAYLVAVWATAGKPD